MKLDLKERSVKRTITREDGELINKLISRYHQKESECPIRDIFPIRTKRSAIVFAIWVTIILPCFFEVPFGFLGQRVTMSGVRFTEILNPIHRKFFSPVSVYAEEMSQERSDDRNNTTTNKSNDSVAHIYIAFTLGYVLTACLICVGLKIKERYY